MKTMLQLLMISGMLFLVGCKKNKSLSFFENKVVGEWRYDKVKYRGSGNLASDDITDEYKRQYLTFKADYSATYVNEVTGESATGLWDVTENFRSGENGEGIVIKNIFASFTYDGSGELFQVIFDNTSATKNKLRATYTNNKGNYRYVLERN